MLLSLEWVLHSNETIYCSHQTWIIQTVQTLFYRMQINNCGYYFWCRYLSLSESFSYVWLKHYLFSSRSPYYLFSPNNINILTCEWTYSHILIQFTRNSAYITWLSNYSNVCLHIRLRTVTPIARNSNTRQQDVKRGRSLPHMVSDLIIWSKPCAFIRRVYAAYSSWDWTAAER